jgi:hypothetical protein
MSEVETYFLVTIHPDGGLSTYTKLPEEPIQATRQATTDDIYRVSQQLVKELDNQLMTNRIVGALVELLTPPQPSQTVPDKVKEALKNRNIEVETEASTD